MQKEFTLKSQHGGVIECAEESQARPKGTVLILHGLGGGKDGEMNKALSAVLVENGFRVVRFNASVGSFKSKEVGAIMRPTIDDLKKMVEHYSKKGNEKIGVIGLSHGGTAAVFAASEEPRISALVTLAAQVLPDFAQLPKNRRIAEILLREKKAELPLGKWRALFKEEFVHERKNFNTFHALEKIKCPVLFLQGDSDKFSPKEHTLLAHASFKGTKAMADVPSNGHNYEAMPSIEAVTQLSLGWFTKHLA